MWNVPAWLVRALGSVVDPSVYYDLMIVCLFGCIAVAFCGMALPWFRGIFLEGIYAGLGHGFMCSGLRVCLEYISMRGGIVYLLFILYWAYHACLHEHLHGIEHSRSIT